VPAFSRRSHKHSCIWLVHMHSNFELIPWSDNKIQEFGLHICYTHGWHFCHSSIIIISIFFQTYNSYSIFRCVFKSFLQVVYSGTSLGSTPLGKWCGSFVWMCPLNPHFINCKWMLVNWFYTKMDLYSQPTWPNTDIKQKFIHRATRGRLNNHCKTMAYLV